jgi:predicted nucleic acid-binding protein
MTERGVLDTTIFIASESGRGLDQDHIPSEVATTVVTLAELEAGVLLAHDSATRSRRLDTLQSISDLEVLSADEATARTWARLRAHLAETRRRVRINDLWIAAIAASRGLPVVTQDDDFDALQSAEGVVLIKV